MDISTLITAVFSSSVLSIGAARWLTQRWVDHKLAKDLKTYQADLDSRLATSKAALDERLNEAKAELEASLRQRVEEYLGDKEAERQYRFDALKRLYTAIGPLRFQLTRACNEFTGRINRIGVGKQAYATSLKGYFGRSTMFRLLRLFAITELIERQIADADFSVDPSMGSLLRFKHESFICLASSTISLNHPKANWGDQVEHVFYDTLSMIASAMIVKDPASNQERVMRFDEFNEFIEDRNQLAALDPIPKLLEDFTLATKPILWIRLVALAELCNTFLTDEGPRVGLSPEPYDGVEMLRAVKDEFITSNHDRYCEMLKQVASTIAEPKVAEITS